MGLFSKQPSDKLPLLGRRDKGTKWAGGKNNYLLRYECGKCGGLYRSASASDHKCKG